MPPVSLQEFFSAPEIQLPMSWTEEDDFEVFIESRFVRYIELVHNLAPSLVKDMVAPRENAIQRCCDGLRAAIRSTFEGHPSDAYETFSNAISEIRTELERQVVNIGAHDLRFMYRVRQSTTPITKREELFHIPFESRHLVATRRYSIPGLPCLYLCGSLYACWEEMGRPPLHQLQAAALWLADGSELKIIDFSRRPKHLLEFAEALNIAGADIVNARLATHIVLWSLMAACSIYVKHRDAPYKPEYIVPQMTLQWVVKNKAVDGVCYFSTHVQPIPRGNALPACNFVFPAKEIKSNGRCNRLCGAFRMTKPFAWELLRAVNAAGGATTGHFDFEFINGFEEQYINTEFGIVESKLAKLAVRIANDNLPDSGEITP